MDSNTDRIDWLNEDFNTPRPEVREAPADTSINQIFSREIAKIFSDNDHDQVTDGKSAMKVVAVAAAVTFLSDQFAALPVHVYRDTENGPERVENDISKLLSGSVNSEYMNFQQLRKTIGASYELNGRGYVQIERDALDRVKNLWPIPFENIVVQRVKGRKVYTERLGNGRVRHHKPEDIIDFVQMLDADGINAYNPVKTNASRLSRILAVEKFAAKTVGSNGIPPLQLRTDKPFQTSANAKRASDAMDDATKVVYSGNKQIITPPANHWLETIGLDPAKLQLLEVRKWDLLEVARIFNLPPQFLQELSFGTYSNTEQQSQNLVKFVLQPRVSSFEREVTTKLFGRDSDLYVKLNFHSLVRGDFTTQINGLTKAVIAGIFTPNEARGLLEYGKVEGGEVLFMQGANQPLLNLINNNQDQSGGNPASNGE